ncbi:MerR family transcriptional regulator [Paenibacillus sp. OV219]|uniref:MerR family transcriptional regulator n=1 Tax=Paenibacillus sp. OV219 TaxID=1884377 RepID=UPI0008C90F8F|nr:MerR family transcriptional regulator [Paenibacillus sp. OV219]SEN59300.1 DNA-binding transcriptional regulator, MerR family [Paenibacillus sp. OV219]
MEYTVQKLGKLAGISTRTLRFYDEIGILKPARMNTSGYRIYGQAEVDRLQHILFYRELGVSLDQIKAMLTDPFFDRSSALLQHRQQLLDRRNQLDALIANVDMTIASAEGRMAMTDKQRFEGFKKQMVDENEQKYGKEVREKYGDDAVNKSNAKLQNMTQEQYDEVTRLAKEVQDTLAEAFKQGDPASELAQKAVDLHRQWLCFYWEKGKYSKEAHANLAQMYVDDERFRAYYDVNQSGAAEFLRDAILIYTGAKQ